MRNQIKKFKKENQTPHTTKNYKRNKIECSSQILEEYKKYYENLLTTRQSEIDYQKNGGQRGNDYTAATIRAVIRRIKNNKAAHRLG